MNSRKSSTRLASFSGQRIEADSGAHRFSRHQLLHPIGGPERPSSPFFASLYPSQTLTYRTRLGGFSSRAEILLALGETAVRRYPVVHHGKRRRFL